LPGTCASGEMADALASGVSVRKDVRVQVPPRAQTTTFLSISSCSYKVAYTLHTEAK
jgi:hypothetical protein